MNSNYVNNKYTIEYHPKQKNEERNLVKPGFGDSIDWTQSTGSSYNTGWTIITGSNESNGGGLGRWLKFTGSSMYTINHNALATAPGVVHWVSKSEGWRVNQVLATGTLGTNVGGNNYKVKWADVDGRTLITSYEGNNELYIFTSRSGGWYQSQTLNKDSWEGPGDIEPDYNKYSFFNCRIVGDTIFSLGHRLDGSYAYYVAWWKSSSAEGWKYHDSAMTTDDSSIGAYGSTNASVGLSSCNIDFDGSRAIAGSKIYSGGGAGNHSSGRLFVFESSSASGWYLDEQLTLSNLGRNSDSGSFAAWNNTYNQEYKLYSHWSYLSSVMSGNYIAASGIGRKIVDSSSDYPYMYRKVKNAIFILKSGSSGWEIEQKIKDPSGRSESASWSAGSLDAHLDDSDFGLGMAFSPDTGDLIVSSPAYNSKFGPEYYYEGRVYIYSSASSTGWTLKQTIENPYSGSVFHANNIGGWHFGGHSTHPEGGFTHEGCKPAASGSLIAIGAPRWESHPAEGSPGYTSIDGAIVLLSGSTPVQPKTIEAVPFRFLSNGPYNLRKQDQSSNHRSFRGKIYV